MAENKTIATQASVADFLAGVEPARKNEDAQALDQIFQEVTGWQPVMWGSSIIGYGEYHYQYDSGREGDFMATGFSPRKANIAMYIMGGYKHQTDILDRIGKFKTGASCFYVNKLADIDTDVLRELIRVGLDGLQQKYEVKPT